MITKRIIPCLYVKDGKVKESAQLGGLRDVASPIELAKFYSANGADELVFYDVAETAAGRALFTDTLLAAARSVFIPMTVGGEVRAVDDFERALSCGADKVSVNSGAIENVLLVKEAAQKYGNQCVVLSVDVKKINGKYHVYTKGGKTDTGMDAIEWIKRCVGDGAGEVVVNSLDAYAIGKGFDLQLLKTVSEAVNVPVIASGGASCQEDFITLFQEVPTVDAGLASSIFHFGEVSISEVKKSMWAKGIPTRI